MKKIFHITVLCMLLASCNRQTESYIKIDGFAQGTTYRIWVQSSDTTGLQNAIDSVFIAVDKSMSVYNPQSLINKVNANETDSIGPYIAHCIEVARKMSELSGGAYDITIKPVTQAIGYAGGNADTQPDIDSLMQYVGYDRIAVSGDRLVKTGPGIQLDLNSVAKGYTSDLMGMLIESIGIKNYMVEIGGEIFCRGKNRKGEDWVVGIDRPRDGNMQPGNDLQATLSISGAGLATSGNYRKFHIDEAGRKVTHIVDARTGQSGFSDVLSATVIAPTCAEADAAATMLTIVGLDKAVELLAQQPQLMAYLVFDNGEGGFGIYETENLRGKIINSRN